MESIELIKERYIALEEQIRIFIFAHTDIEYVQGSSEVVEGGAFTWAELSPESKFVQTKLYHEYISLIKQANRNLKKNGSSYLETFETSCTEVKSYLKQENLLWGSSLQEVFNAVKKELDLQRGLMAQTICCNEV